MAHRRFAPLILSLLFTPLVSTAVRAEDLWADEGGDKILALNGAIKSTSVMSHAPDDPVLFPEPWSAVQLFRARASLNFSVEDWLTSEVAYEHRARLESEDAGFAAGGQALPREAAPPYRLTPLDWELVGSGDSFSYRHELDRILVALHPAWGEVTVGRQAIGLGRGVLYGAVDVFAPFSPLEIDREWRRGVDAVRCEYRILDQASVEILGASGESWDDSALLGRARGYLGDFDGELIIGKRGRDEMYGAVASATIQDAEVHVELALFDTPEEPPDGGLLGAEHLVGKAVVGSSYTFAVGNGLTMLGEYHYSGFGVEDIEDAVLRLLDPDFQERFLRGDTQILGQHAMALQASYPLRDVVRGSVLLIASPVDGSGIAVPSVHWDFAQDVSVLASVYVPWGPGPAGGQLQSEYGATPTSFYLQLTLYF